DRGGDRRTGPHPARRRGGSVRHDRRPPQPDGRAGNARGGTGAAALSRDRGQVGGLLCREGVVMRAWLRFVWPRPAWIVAVFLAHAVVAGGMLLLYLK